MNFKTSTTALKICSFFFVITAIGCNSDGKQRRNLQQHQGEGVALVDAQAEDNPNPGGPNFVKCNFAGMSILCPGTLLCSNDGTKPYCIPSTTCAETKTLCGGYSSAICCSSDEKCAKTFEGKPECFKDTEPKCNPDQFICYTGVNRSGSTNPVACCSNGDICTFDSLKNVSACKKPAVHCEANQILCLSDGRDENQGCCDYPSSICAYGEDKKTKCDKSSLPVCAQVLIKCTSECEKDETCAQKCAAACNTCAKGLPDDGNDLKCNRYLVY